MSRAARRPSPARCLLAVAAFAAAPLLAQPPSPIATVAAVRHLTEAQAAQHLPVQVRGVVTSFSGWEDAFFLQDRTGGIAINRMEKTSVHPGDEILLTGFSDPGKFAASIYSTHIRILGHAPPPKAVLHTFASMVGGSQDSQWIRVRGVVEAARILTVWNRPVLVLHVAAESGIVEVRILNYTADDPARLLDALVTLDGVCGTAYNEKRQFTGLRLFVPDAANAHILQPPPADPYAVPLSPVAAVLQYSANAQPQHRVRIRGTVTYRDPGRSLFLQNGPNGILVATDSIAPPLGADVEAIGFPTLTAYSPSLRNAEVRSFGPGRPVSPIATRAGDFLQTADTFEFAPHDSQLVRLRGKLISILPGPHGDDWLIQDGRSHFVAVSTPAKGVPDTPPVEPGTLIAVTGVLVVQLDEDLRPRFFRVLMRGPADVRVLQRASWWTARHTLPVLAAVLLVMCAAVLWGFLLRRQVWQQTQMLRESEERFRRQAQHDALTGLASRAFLHEQLHDEVRNARRHHARIGVLMIDLDHFKEVNDTMGHHAGDELLCIVGDRIARAVRKTDTVARMGGDEFVVLLKNIEDPAEAELIGAKVVANVSAPAHIEGHLVHVSASVGVCLFPDHGLDGEALLQNVDAAMYKAKAGGRNSFSVYQPTPAKLTEPQPCAATPA